jgi:4'-phosphopantetheinyl transferase
VTRGPVAIPVEVAAVELWRAELNQGWRDQQAGDWHCLDREERERAFRFRLLRDRNRFVASRGTLRHILSHYLGQPPEALRFGYTTAGKPFLFDHPELQFNLSHAENVLLVGVTRERPLGVDIEPVPPASLVDATSHIALSRPERQVMEMLSGQARREGFARLWTRKEAYLKADGRGIWLELDRIDVATDQHRVLLRAKTSDDWTVSPRWSVRSTELKPGYAASVAAEGDDWELASFVWPNDSRLAC